MSSTVASTGSPTSRRTLTSRSQSQENTAFDDEKPQMRSVSELSNYIYPIPISRTRCTCIYGVWFCNSPVLHTYLSFGASSAEHSHIYNPHVLITQTNSKQDPASMLKKSTSALSSSKLVNQVPKVSLNLDTAAATADCNCQILASTFQFKLKLTITEGEDEPRPSIFQRTQPDG